MDDYTYSGLVEIGLLGRWLESILIKYNKDLMNVNTFHNEIDFLLEKLEDLLNENFGIAPIGITKWKNSNCLEY